MMHLPAPVVYHVITKGKKSFILKEYNRVEDITADSYLFAEGISFSLVHALRSNGGNKSAVIANNKVCTWRRSVPDASQGSI